MTQTEYRGGREGGHMRDQQYHAALASSPIMLARVDRDLRYEWILNPLRGETD